MQASVLFGQLMGFVKAHFIHVTRNEPTVPRHVTLGVVIPRQLALLHKIQYRTLVLLLRNALIQVIVLVRVAQEAILALMQVQGSCAMWVSNGFCTASWYTCDQKRQYCASSCNIGGCNPQITCSGSVAATTKITTTPSTTIRVTTTTTIPVTTTTTTIPATTTTTTIPVTTTTTTIPATTTTTTIPVTTTTTTIPTTTTTPLGQQSICPNLIQVVSFRNTASPSSYENLLAFGASEISQYRSNPTNYTELEKLGYCAQTSCYCGASMPLYYIVGTFSTGMLDHFYTTSFEEMNSLNTNSGSIYYNGSKGIPCYIWKFNSTTQCNTYC
uniref:ShKT domain-containing protein n=1 Tax=Acrobeloides nanus TaxID=290746 RepID=A0A914CCU0_9BILA